MPSPVVFDLSSLSPYFVVSSSQMFSTTSWALATWPHWCVQVIASCSWGGVQSTRLAEPLLGCSAVPCKEVDLHLWAQFPYLSNGQTDPCFSGLWGCKAKRQALSNGFFSCACFCIIMETWFLLPQPFTLLCLADQGHWVTDKDWTHLRSGCRWEATDLGMKPWSMKVSCLSGLSIRKAVWLN